MIFVLPFSVIVIVVRILSVLFDLTSIDRFVTVVVVVVICDEQIGCSLDSSMSPPKKAL